MDEVITEGDLLEAILLAQEGSEEGQGMTTQELSRATGRSLWWVRQQLHKLNRAGRLKAVKVFRRKIDGDRQRVSAYRLVEPEEKQL